MEKLTKILSEWLNDHTWVGGNPNLLVKRDCRVDLSNQRPNYLEVEISISDATLIVNGTVAPFGLTKCFNTSQLNPSTNEIPQQELDRLKQEIEDFTKDVIKTREGHIANWVKSGDKVETTDPLSMK